MELQISISKTKKYAISLSGDTVEIVERPNGGLSVVMVDGQSSGKGAKTISTMVVRKVISLLAEGVRDGAAARAASDTLYTERGGKVSATLNILSIDQQTRTLVITRNNPSPVLFFSQGEFYKLDQPSQPVGLYRDTRPVISEIDLKPGLIVLAFTDGLIHAGERIGKPMDVFSSFVQLIEENIVAPDQIADALLHQALRLDDDRPADDISIVVVTVAEEVTDNIRRMNVRFPLTG